MSEERPTLLWVDDDEERRFKHEKSRIDKIGWDVAWANDAREAAQKLQENTYDTIFLDQMLPYRKGNLEDKKMRPWGGCLLLYWLRGKEKPRISSEIPGFRDLKSYKPRPQNSRIPAMVISAYYGDAVRETMVRASDLDADLPFVAKPADVTAIIRFLKNLRNGS